MEHKATKKVKNKKLYIKEVDFFSLVSHSAWRKRDETPHADAGHICVLPLAGWLALESGSWPLVELSPGIVLYHCCQLKSSWFPNTRKKPKMVEKMTVFPVRTSAHAPHAIRCALAKMIGSPNADTTMPVVRKMASSLQALLAASVSSTTRLAMQYGIGANT